MIDEESKSRITTQANVSEMSEKEKDETIEERMSDPDGPQSETESEKFENVSGEHKNDENQDKAPNPPQQDKEAPKVDNEEADPQQEEAQAPDVVALRSLMKTKKAPKKL